MIDLVGDIDDVETHRQRTRVRKFKGVTHAGVDLNIARRVIAIRDDIAIRKSEIIAQSAAEDRIDAQASALPPIGDAARSGRPTFVIEVDVVARDVVEIRLAEVELRRFHTLAVGGLPGGIEVGLKIVVRVVDGEFHASDQAVAVIEGRENDRSAELPLVDQVLRLLVEGVDTEGEVFVKELLFHAEVVIILPRGDRGRVLGHRARRQGAGARELRERLGTDELERRRREIPRVAAVQSRTGIELPHEVDPRTELAAAGISAVTIEAQTVIEGEGCEHLPFVLHIHTLDLLHLRAAADNGLRHIGSLHAGCIDG